MFCSLTACKSKRNYNEESSWKCREPAHDSNDCKGKETVCSVQMCKVTEVRVGQSKRPKRHQSTACTRGCDVTFRVG